MSDDGQATKSGVGRTRTKRNGLRVDRRAALFMAAGVLFGALVVGALWARQAAAEEGAIRMALIQIAKCDERGMVNVTFPGAGDFTCVPRQEIPPMQRPKAKAF